MRPNLSFYMCDADAKGFKLDKFLGNLQVCRTGKNSFALLLSNQRVENEAFLLNESLHM